MARKIDRTNLLGRLPARVATLDPALSLRAPENDDLRFAESLYLENTHQYRTNGAKRDEGALRANLQEMLDPRQVLIIWRQDSRLGWLQIAENDAVRLRQIHLVESARGQHIGTTIMTCIMQLAAAQNRAVELSVMEGNTAVRFYERLGFVITGHADDRVNMRWRPPGSAA